MLQNRRRLTRILQSTLSCELPELEEAREEAHLISDAKIDGKGIKNVYGFSQNNWGDLDIFQGDFINYGYWKNVPFSSDAPLTINQRIASSLELYKLTAKYLNILPSDVVMEVGSGRGIGAMCINQEYELNKLIGLDYTPAQTVRSNKLLNSSQALNCERITFETGDALSTPFEDECFDKIYSVEAIQHIEDIKRYAEEMRRVISPGGRIAVSTYLHTDSCDPVEAKKLLPLIDQRLENELTASQVKEAFIAAGFSWVDVHRIGAHVFPGYFKWAMQVGATNKFTYNYLKAFEEKLIDYYLVVAS